MIKEIECPVCGKKRYGTAAAVYCSNTCKNIAWRRSKRKKESDNDVTSKQQPDHEQP